MDKIGITIAITYGVIISITIGLLIFLIIRRVKIKKKETFEKRDN